MRILPESGITNEMICQTQVELLEQQRQEYKLIGSMRKVPGHTNGLVNTMWQAAEHFKCSYEAIRKYWYYYTDVNL